MSTESTWYDYIPDSWRVISFNHVIKRMSTGLNPRENFVLSKNDEYCYVTIRNFKDNQLFLDDNCDKISRQAWEIIQARSDLHEGDILFASISKDGQAYLLDKEPTNWNINESIFCIRVDEKIIDKRYFRYEITNSGYYAELLLDATGSTFKSIKQNKLRQSKIVVPPLSEQQAIADYLDDRCSKIDEIIAEAEKSIEEYKELKQAVIFEAVTKGLDKNVPMKDSGYEFIGSIPSHWKVTQLKRICKKITDGSHYSPDTVNDGMPYVTAGDVHGKGINYETCRKISKEDFRALVKSGCQPCKGDVLLVKDGATTGRVGLMVDNEDCVLLSSVAMLTPIERICSEYLMYLLDSNVMQYQIRKSMAGSAMPRTTLTKLIAYIAIDCPVEDQVEIIDFLDCVIPEYDALISEKQALIEDLKSYKKSLIYEVVTGKRRIS